MLHGNPLLHGWQLSDVSFYTTELPQYMLLELVSGLGPDVVHLAAAMTYTLLVLRAAMLAKGRATGRAGLLRAGSRSASCSRRSWARRLRADAVAGPHRQTVPVLLAWILLDRAGRRWYVPPAAGVLLAWALVADNIVLITGVAAAGRGRRARAYRRSWSGAAARCGGLVRAGPGRGGGGRGAGAPGGAALIAGHGGFYVVPVDNPPRAVQRAMPQHLMLTLQGMLLLFGADFFGHNLGLVAALAMLHLVGVVLAAAATWAASCARSPGRDLVTRSWPPR